VGDSLGVRLVERVGDLDRDVEDLGETALSSQFSVLRGSRR
jgi:hypothetical protein